MGESLAPIYKHEPWLTGINQFGIKKVVCAFGRPTMKHEQGSYWKLHPERFTREDKFYEIADRTRLPHTEAALDSLMQDLAKCIYFTCTIVVNPSSDIVDTPYAIRSNDVYWGMGVEAKHVAYTIGIKSSNVFGGGGRIVECDFDVNCYDSVGLTRCLEVD
jgi:hypothetical protein